MQNDQQNSENQDALEKLPLFANLPPQMPHRILRLPEVMTRVGLKRASIYQRIRTGYFPKPVPLGPRAVGWLENEVEEWLAACIQRRGTRRATPLPYMNPPPS